MNKVTEQELVDRLETARALATKITALQDAKNKLTSLVASEHAVDITITSSILHPVKFQASTSRLAPFEPTNMRCILSSALLVVEEKLDKLKQVYEEL